jgi:hypothetical protein
MVNIGALSDTDALAGIKRLLRCKYDVAIWIAVRTRESIKRHKENAVFVIHGLLGRNTPLFQESCAAVCAMSSHDASSTV